MNILILTWLFPPHTGGVSTYTMNLARALSRNHKIIVLSTGQEDLNEKKEPFKIIRIDEMYPRSKNKQNPINLAKKLKQILREEKIDLIHAHNLIYFSEDYSSTIINTAKECLVPIIDHCHDGRKEYINKNLVKSSVGKFIAVSNFIKNNLINVGVDENKIEVVYNSIDYSMFNPKKYNREKARQRFNLPINKKIILFPSRAIRPSTGKFGEQKNFETVLDSIPKIKKSIGNNFVLVFPENVGSYVNEDEKNKTLKLLDDRLKKEGIDDNVIGLKEEISFKDMPLLYKSADIVCTPSVNEAFGLVFLEAMSMGIPVIGAKSGAVPEVIDEGINGFLIKPQDSKELSNKIIKLMQDDKLRLKIGEDAKTGIKKKFSFEKMIKEINDIYFELKYPQVSVIIPVYNCDKYIEETVKSVLAQKYQDFEIILVNDASTDKSLEIIKKLQKKDGRIKIFNLKKNKGAAGALNEGIKNARGRYIAKLDGDDLMGEDRLKNQMNFLENHSEIDMVYSDCITLMKDGTRRLDEAPVFKNINEPLNLLKKAFKRKDLGEIPPHYFLKDKLNRNLASGSATLRKTVFNKIKFDENLRNTEDYDFWLQLIGAEFKIAKTKGIGFYYRKHENQKSSNKEKMKIAAKYINNKLKNGEYFK